MKRYLRSNGRSVVFLGSVILSAFYLTSPVSAASWETVKEFYGTITITQVLDYEAELDGGQKQILRKNVSATVSVTGSATDGAYYWPVGTISGTMTTENIMINKDGSTVHGTFEGTIDKSFGLEHHGGPEQAICHAGADPLPITWTGSLWFGKPDGSGWSLGVTDVGGKNNIQIECP